jgi:hypothetical protein
MSLPSQYPWPFVSAQLTNAKGNEIFHLVINNRDRQWLGAWNGLSDNIVIWPRMTWMSFKLNMRTLSASLRRRTSGNMIRRKYLCSTSDWNKPIKL